MKSKLIYLSQHLPSPPRWGGLARGGTSTSARADRQETSSWNPKGGYPQIIQN
jgi:hypothetical protein